MAAKIEHYAKRSAYLKGIMWGESLTISKADMLWSEKQDYAAHEKYCKEMEESGTHYYGSAPRSRILNWVAHKLLEFCWGKGIYE